MESNTKDEKKDKVDEKLGNVNQIDVKKEDPKSLITKVDNRIKTKVFYMYKYRMLLIQKDMPSRTMILNWSY